MKKLLRVYGFNSDMQYYEMIAESYINGQKAQALQQFQELPKANKKEVIKSMLTTWQGMEKLGLFLLDAI